MDMVEVDRQLFVTCRLCIGDLGAYQILPHVQQQIKYCFDIDVDLYDGLPQLICKKCKTILQEYFDVKQSFVEKQTTLRTKLAVKTEANNKRHHDNNLREESGDSSTQDADECIKPTRGKRKRFRLMSSTSSENLKTENTDIVSEVSKKKHKPSKDRSWKEFYKRKFVCQLCSKMCKKKNNLTKHLKEHNTLLLNYSNVFSRDCKVKLIKIDDNLNITGSDKNVVVSSDRILSKHEGSNNYCVIYIPKKDRSGSRLNSSDGCENNQDLNRDSDEDIVENKDRTSTRSSNETVILNDDDADVRENSNGGMSDEDENTHLSDAECINIDDSSDSESTKSNRVLRDSADMNPVKAKIADHKAIQNIISTSLNRYLKRNECAENEMSKSPAFDESKLKRIILNMGQKVVSKQGFNCTGLLRFMENSDLNIKWVQANPRSPKNIGKESNYVYIQPKLVSKLNSKLDHGWTDISGHEVLPVNHLFETEDSDSLRVCSKNSTKSAVPLTLTSQTDKAQGKLLNKSPVANPKQLPKKTYTNQSSENTDPEPLYATDEVNGNNLCMPIITSTTSLAVPATEVQETLSTTENSAVLNHNDVNSNSKNVNKSIVNSAVSNNKNENEAIENPEMSNKKNENESIENSTVSDENVNESKKSAPRIKVKSVTELMSDRALKTLSQTQQVNTANIWDTPQSSNIQPVVVNHLPILVPNGTNDLPVQALQLVPYQCADTAASAVNVAVSAPAATRLAPASARPAPAEKEYVVLDTAELPNTKTDSPFKYVKKLLQLHNLILLDSHESLTRDFVCLIKFKLQFKQETIDPVILFLSFLCFGNKFYLGVKPNEQENNIDLSRLPPNWQWEIINKVYREEVVSKVLKNAQKICQSTHEYAKNFLCLLKSIKKLDT